MSDEQQMGCGGLNEVKDADEKIQQLCDQVRPEAEQMAKKKFQQFEAKTFGTQTVYGYNYFVKVHVGGENYVHLKIYKKPRCDSGEVELTALQGNHNSTSPITLF